MFGGDSGAQVFDNVIDNRGRSGIHINGLHRGIGVPECGTTTFRRRSPGCRESMPSAGVPSPVTKGSRPSQSTIDGTIPVSKNAPAPACGGAGVVSVVGLPDANSREGLRIPETDPEREVGKVVGNALGLADGHVDRGRQRETVDDLEVRPRFPRSHNRRRPLRSTTATRSRSRPPSSNSKGPPSTTDEPTTS